MPLNLLLLEDNPADVDLVRLHLEDVGFDGNMEHVDSVAGAIENVTKSPPDVVLLDLDVIDSRGLDTLDTFRRSHPKIGVVVLTGRNDPENALEALRRGAHDYVVKDDADGTSLMRAADYANFRQQNPQNPSRAGQITMSTSSGWMAPREVDRHIASGHSVVWVSLNRSHDQATGAIKDASRVFVVDGSMSSIANERAERVTFVPSPSALEAIGLRVDRAARTLEAPVIVVIDTLDVILMHSGRDETREFCHYMANTLRMAGHGCTFLVANQDASDSLAADIKPFLDSIA